MTADGSAQTPELGRPNDPSAAQMRAPLWQALPFDVSLRVWGYEVAGDASNTVALIAERPADAPWDRRAHDLAGIERWHGSVRMPVPEWWALYVAPDLVMKGAA